MDIRTVNVTEKQERKEMIRKLSKYPPLPKLIVHDNFVDDRSLLNAIREDEEFWELGYNWWDGWWQSEASTLRHELIEFIYKKIKSFETK